MGRTGTLFACEQEGVIPDLLTIAKGLGAGYQPIGAVMVGKHIFAAIRDGSGFFQHGHTYLGHAIGCAISRGMLCYPMGGTIDGRQGDHVLLAPPFIIDEGHGQMIADVLDAAIDAAIHGIDQRFRVRSGAKG